MVFIYREFKVSGLAKQKDEILKTLAEHNINSRIGRYFTPEYDGNKLYDLCTYYVDCSALEEDFEKLIADLKNDSKGSGIRSITY